MAPTRDIGDTNQRQPQTSCARFRGLYMLGSDDNDVAAYDVVGLHAI